MLHHQYNFYKDLKVDNYKNALPIIGHDTTKKDVLESLDLL